MAPATKKTLAPLAAGVAGSGSLLSAGLIIWAMSGWVCLSRRIRVISRVNAAGSSTSSFASASGLSRTMTMSISPPSLWIIVGRPACTSARIATALFSHKVRSHSSRALCASVSVCGGALRAAVVPNALRKGLSLLGRGYRVAWGMEDAEWPLLHARGHLFALHMT